MAYKFDPVLNIPRKAGLSARATDNGDLSITISYSGFNLVGADPTGYWVIEESVDGGAYGQASTQVAAVLNVTLDDRSPGSSYVYRVKAYDSNDVLLATSNITQAISIPSVTTQTFASTYVTDNSYGRFDSTTNAARFQSKMEGASFQFRVRGSSCQLKAGSGYGTTAKPYLVSIDGGEDTDPSLSDGLLTLFSGLPDTYHTVTLRTNLAHGEQSWVTIASDSLSVTGSYPSASADPQFGPSVKIGTSNAWSENLYTSLTAPVSPNWGRSRNNDSFRFRATIETGKSIYALCGGDAVISYEIDGVKQSTNTTIPVGGVDAWKLTKIADAVGDGTEHEYTIVSTNTARLDTVIIGGATSSFSTASLSTRPYIFAMGDSITNGNNCSITSLDGSYAYKLARLIGGDVFNAGIGGNVPQDMLDRIASEMSSMRKAQDLSILYAGHNGADGTTQTPYTGLLDYLIANTSQPIVAVLLPGEGAKNTEITNAVAACSNPSRVTIADLSALSYDSCDGLHPTAAGAATIAAALEPTVSALL